MPPRFLALCLALIAPLPAAADWLLDRDGEGPGLAIGPGDFGLSLRMLCGAEGYPSYSLAGLLVAGLAPEQSAGIAVDGRAFGPFAATCTDADTGACALTVPEPDANGLSQALRAGARAVVTLGGTELQTISLRGSNAAIGGLVSDGCAGA